MQHFTRKKNKCPDLDHDCIKIYNVVQIKWKTKAYLTLYRMEDWMPA